MSDVPDEILRDILSRMPVAPLLRFRCVSKSWMRLIDNQQFIKHHLNHSQNTNSNLNIILDGERHLYSADFDLLNETNMATFQELTHPLEGTYVRTQVLGSCDGLLVLRNYKDDYTILWNPSVRRFHEIPSRDIEFSGHTGTLRCVVYGFGYDVVSDDYKLVRIVEFNEKGKDDSNSEVNVYSLKSGSWRKIPDFPYYMKFKMNNVLVNGVLHWVVGREGAWNTDSLIAAFDLGTEEFTLMPLPKLASNDPCLILGVMGGCLSVMYCNEYEDEYEDLEEEHVEVWVMKEYGVQESWSHLFALDICDVFYLKLIAYSKCGGKALLWSDKGILTSYDLDTKSIELPMLLEMPVGNNHGVHICLQSLVLLNNGSCDFDFFTRKIQIREIKTITSLKRWIS